MLEDRVTGGPIFAGEWSLKTDFAEGQGHWRTGSQEDQPLLEDRVTGGPAFAGGQGHWKQDFAGGQDHWIAGLVCGQDFAGVHDFAGRLDFAGTQDCKTCLQEN